VFEAAPEVNVLGLKTDAYFNKIKEYVNE